ncbi:MAG: 3-keto-disaccharide hydrolase [Cyclobacteriaceae bacterium]
MAGERLNDSVVATSTAVHENWIPLFNGRDLEGWTVKIAGHELGENFGNTFRVEDGVMKTAYDQYENFDGQYGHIFYKDPFSHYRLRLEYRFTGEQATGGEGWAFRNSGIMVHGQSPESMAKDQDFPISVEIQLLGGNGTDDRTTANMCSPGTHVEIDGQLVTDHCINSSSQTYHGDQWVSVEIVVLGESLIQHVVDGDTVMTYAKPQVGGGVVNKHHPEAKIDGTILRQGYISLQSESHPVEFRNVELLDLAEYYQ